MSETETLFSQLSTNSAALTVVAPDLISEFEMNFWYHGISGKPPKLMYRYDADRALVSFSMVPTRDAIRVVDRKVDGFAETGSVHAHF